MKSKVKKSNAGRKPVPDKKVQVSLYIRQSEIEKFGGIEKMKDAIYEFVALRSQNGIKEIEGISKFSKYNSETLLYDTACSVRLLNILKANDDKLGITVNWETKLKDLNGVSMSNFLQCRGAGKKTLEELKELCFYSGVELSI